MSDLKNSGSKDCFKLQWDDDHHNDHHDDDHDGDHHCFFNSTGCSANPVPITMYLQEDNFTDQKIAAASVHNLITSFSYVNNLGVHTTVVPTLAGVPITTIFNTTGTITSDGNLHLSNVDENVDDLFSFASTMFTYHLSSGKIGDINFNLMGDVIATIDESSKSQAGKTTTEFDLNLYDAADVTNITLPASTSANGVAVSIVKMSTDLYVVNYAGDHSNSTDHFNIKIFNDFGHSYLENIIIAKNQGDTIIGTSLAEGIFGGNGNDHLDSGPGFYDTISGGNGNDVITVHSPGFAMIDGGN